MRPALSSCKLQILITKKTIRYYKRALLFIFNNEDSQRFKYQSLHYHVLQILGLETLDCDTTSFPSS